MSKASPCLARGSGLKPLLAVLSLVLLLLGWAAPAAHAAACAQPHHPGEVAGERQLAAHDPQQPGPGCMTGVCVHAHCHVCCVMPVPAGTLPVLATPDPTPPTGGFVRTPAPRPAPRPPADLLVA